MSDVLLKLQGISSEADAYQLLDDIPVLLEWQRSRKPTNQVRDAMLKLGSQWRIPRQINGKKRSPGDVAQDVEESMLKKAKILLNNSVVKPVLYSRSFAKEARS